MTIPVETNEETHGQPSPYAPPPTVEEPIKVGPSDLPASLPISVSLAYAIGATVASFALILGASSANSDLTGYLLMGSPIVLMAGFVLVCFAYFERGGSSVRSFAWKALMTVLAPIASMILFLPTCFTTGVLAFTTLGFALGEAAIAIPVFFAYWVTCCIVAIRIRSRMALVSGVAASGPYSKIETAPEEPK